MVLRAVVPVPKQARNRLPDSRAMEAIAEAIAISERSLGMRTAVPKPIREVRSAANARWTNGSSQRGAESRIQTRE
jgi:hypothetical protein